MKTHRIAALLCGLTLAAAAPAMAVPVTYDIAFTTATGAPAPTSGFFTFDGSVFSNFQVVWDGWTIDLTSAANVPRLGDEFGGPGTAIDGFALMSQINNSPGTGRIWLAAVRTLECAAGSCSFPMFSFVEFNTIQVTHTTTRIGPEPSQYLFGAAASGSWLITPRTSEISVPEPGTAVLLLTGAMVLFASGTLRRGAPRRR